MNERGQVARPAVSAAFGASIAAERSEGPVAAEVEARLRRRRALDPWSATPPKRNRCCRSDGPGHLQVLQPLEVPAGSAQGWPADPGPRGAFLHCELDRVLQVAYTEKLLLTVRHEPHPCASQAHRVASSVDQMAQPYEFDHGSVQGEQHSSPFQRAVRAPHQPGRLTRMHHRQ